MAQTVQDNEKHRIVMTCVIYKREASGFKYLVTKRAPTKKVFPNMWTVPGGGLELYDYIGTQKTTDDAWYFVLEGALRREVKEEVNLEIKKPEYLLDLVFIRPDNVPVLTLSFYAEYKSGDVKLEENDAVEFRWVSAHEAKDLKFISGIASEINMVDKILNGQDHNKIKIE